MTEQRMREIAEKHAERWLAGQCSLRDAQRDAYAEAVAERILSIGEAKIRRMVEEGWIYCPDCGSCGVGGCCPFYCNRCKHRHDGDDDEGGDSPEDRGDMSREQTPSQPVARSVVGD